MVGELMAPEPAPEITIKWRRRRKGEVLQLGQLVRFFSGDRSVCKIRSFEANGIIVCEYLNRAPPENKIHIFASHVWEVQDE